MVRVHSRHILVLPLFVAIFYLVDSMLKSKSSNSSPPAKSDLSHSYLQSQPNIKLRPPSRNTEATDQAMVDRLGQILEQNVENRTDCPAILDGHAMKMISAGFLVKDITGDEGAYNQERKRVEKLIRMMSRRNCKDLEKEYGFINHHLTEEERGFPIAFSLTIYENMDYFMKLMAAIYRPQNFYCIHLDAEAQPAYNFIITQFAECFPNVMAPKARIKVEWGKWSVVAADIRCMELLHKKKGWQYFINLSGDDFPLKTNYELVQILKAFKGANDVFGSHIIKRPRRWATSDQPQPPGITPVTGHRQVAVNREFVDFVLFSNESKALQKFMEPALIPDEVFYPTINHNTHLGVRGSFMGLSEIEAEIGRKPSFIRFKLWYTDKCSIRVSGGVCTLAIGELYNMVHSPFMFANKFKMSIDPLVIGCLSQYIANRTLQFYVGGASIDTSQYESSVIVRNMVAGNRTDKGWF